MADDLLTMKIAIDDRDYLKVQRSQKNFQYSLVEIERAYRNNEINAKQYNRQLVIQSKNLQKLGFSYAEASSQIRKYSYSLRNATKDQLDQAQAVAQSGKGMRRFELLAQQAGYQVGDFAVQVQSGTNIAVAFGQQMSQLLGFLGPYGALAGAGIAITTGIIAPFLKAGEKARDLKQEVEELNAEVAGMAGAGVSIESGITQKLVDAQVELLALIGLAQSESFKMAMGMLSGQDAGQAMVATEAVDEELEARKNLVSELDRERNQAAILVTQQRVLNSLVNDQVQEAQNVADANRIVSGIYEDHKELSEWQEGFQERQDKLAKSRWAEWQRRQKERKKEADAEARERDRISNLVDTELTKLTHRNAVLQMSLQFGKDSAAVRNLEVLNAVEAYEKELERKGVAEETVKQLSDQLSLSLRLTNQLRDQVEQAREFKKQIQEVSKSYTEMLEKRVIADVFDPRGEEGTTATQALRLGFDPFENDDDDDDKGKGKKSDFQNAMERYQEFLKGLELEERISRELVDVFGSERNIQEELMRLKYEYAILGKQFDEEEVERTLRKIDANEKYRQKIEEAKQKQEEIADMIGDKFEGAMMSIVDGTKSVEDAFRMMAAEIIKELYRVLVVQQMVNAAKAAMGGGGGNFFSSLFGGGRAEGGPVKGGTTYLVGERGPELFTPASSGNITPNHELGGGDTTVIQNINISTGVQQTVRTEIKQLMPAIADSAKKAVLDGKRRGGSYGKAFG
jgi:hypothetical protein